ncbi:MAG: type I-U CRISPR-associated protein Cas8c [Gammaproteobacteria bacterium]|nr:type I-U CRISPR-associated protein Cas8c [Gammaproteobacteria bacterium]
MAESIIPVDLLNPGQVFACLGIMEAAEVLLGEVQGAFDWDDGSEARFLIVAAGSEPPIERVMRFLEEAEVIARAPAEADFLDKWNENWGKEPQTNTVGTPFPSPNPDKPAKLPAVLRDDSGFELTIDYWADSTKRDDVKFWAGSRGKPGVAIVREALDSVRGMIRQMSNNPFAIEAKQTISLRFDWRRDYIPVQDGFSPNNHRTERVPISMVGFPVVEVLAAFGMTNARPYPKSKTRYSYTVLGLGQYESRLTDLTFHRAALGSKDLPIPNWPNRRFLMHLDYPGRDGDARCITQVTEETNFHGISVQ